MRKRHLCDSAQPHAALPTSRRSYLYLGLCIGSVLCISLGLAACGPPQTSEPNTPQTPNTPETQSATADTSTDSTASSNTTDSETPTPAQAEAKDAKPTTQADRGSQDYNRIIKENRDKFRSCFDSAVATNPGIKGTVTLGWRLDPKGTVKEARVVAEQSDIHIDSFETCMVSALRTLTFPPSTRGLDSTVRYPFDFK